MLLVRRFQICKNTAYIGIGIGKTMKTARCFTAFANHKTTIHSINPSKRVNSYSQYGSYFTCRLLSTSSNEMSRSQSESMTEEDPSGGFAAKIKAKFGSRLVGWDPRESNDGLPCVVYNGSLKEQIRMLKLFSFSTTVLGLTFQAVLIEQLKDSSLLAKSTVLGVIGFFVFVSPLLIHLMAKRYVTDMTYDPKSDTYTSATYSFLLRRIEVKFKLEDVIVPTVPGLLTTILVKSGDKKLPLFLADVCFNDLRHYGRLMGFDKPIDFGISQSDIESELKQKKLSSASSVDAKQKPRIRS